MIFHFQHPMSILRGKHMGEISSYLSFAICKHTALTNAFKQHEHIFFGILDKQIFWKGNFTVLNSRRVYCQLPLPLANKPYENLLRYGLYYSVFDNPHNIGIVYNLQGWID